MISCSKCKEAALFEVAQMDWASLVIGPREPFCVACMGTFIQKKAGRARNDYVFVVKKVKETK